ncbi:MAG: glycosyltransferase family 39 protein [Chloroflexi bacterium]|nr:glycosyltransferase family 39 protein [Chloroflexota bacterium]
MRTAGALYLLALAVRALLIATFPDAAYPDSAYYVDVGREIAAGHGLSVPFIWIFAEVGNAIPANPTLPIPSNAHWLPLASFLQAPFIALLGPSAIASAIPMALVGALAAPLTWAIARDAKSRPVVAIGAGVLSAIPGAGTVFLAQPENFAILHPLVAATLWLAARGLKGDGRAFALAGLLAGLASLARNDGVLLAGAVGLVWLLDRLRWWRRRTGSGGWARVDDRRPVSWAAAAGFVVLFLVVMGPWWLRQLTTFGSISPTSSSGAALWILDISEWNSITAHPTLERFLAQGPAAILASRLDGLASAIGNFVVVIASIVLLPFLLLGMLARRGAPDFRPWFIYSLVVFAGATFIYPLHVPGGAFIHSAIGLAPHAAILSLEGVLLVVGAVASRRRTWREDAAGSVFAWGIVAIVIATAFVFGRQTQAGWASLRTPRVELAAQMAELGVGPNDRLLTIDAAGWNYWTGRPGVVTPDDPIETIEAVARAYETRWLIVEREDAARALAVVLQDDERPPWIGPAAYSIPAADGGTPRLALYPVCTQLGDSRCDE